MLLGLRAQDSTKADSDLHGENTWTMPGGKIRLGETFEQAAARELTEETSLIGKNFKLFSVSNDIIPGVHFITIGILCDDFTGEVKAMEPNEIVEWHWFSVDNPPVNMFFPSRKMLEHYLKQIFYTPNDK